MKAAQIDAYGTTEAIRINPDAPAPLVGPGQIRVEVKAAGLNPVDTIIRLGYFHQFAPLQFPATLGGDFAGIVTEVGAEVTNLEVGDEVYGQAMAIMGGSGSLAEQVVTNASVVARKPRSLDFIQSAALPLTGLSALQALSDHVKVHQGQTILIHGAAGGVGGIAVQVAKHLGAYVVATAGSDDVDYVKGLGADQVIDYKRQAFELGLSDLDAVIDNVGGETYRKSFEVLKKGGVIVSLLEQPDTDRATRHEVTALIQQTAPSGERLAMLATLVDDGVVTPRIDKQFALDDVVEAFTHRETGHPRGKVVVTVSKSPEE